MANGRKHWRAKDRERRAYLNGCDIQQGLGVIAAPPTRPLAHAQIAACLTMPNPMDDDNAMARLKWAVDWLATRGYFVRDSRKHLTWRGLPDQRITRKEPPHVTFTITPTVEDYRAA